MNLQEHLQATPTTICRCWAVTRSDGTVYGFTDHDQNLAFEGVTFRADTGLTASALQQVTGLAVDNTEAVGALSDAAIKEEDIAAGRFDGATIISWMVNWSDVTCREVLFKGTMGELKRTDGAFYAELRGISEALNVPVGRVFQKPCQAHLGDAACGVDLSIPGYRLEIDVQEVSDRRVFTFEAFAGAEERWFERGRLLVLSGAASGLVGHIKNDRTHGADRVIELWQGLGHDVVSGDLIRLEAGCDKRVETCRLKFQNIVNFQGFPHIPGEDWLMSYPSESGGNTGGSRYQ